MVIQQTVNPIDSSIKCPGPPIWRRYILYAIVISHQYNIDVVQSFNKNFDKYWFLIIKNKKYIKSIFKKS